MVTPQSFKPPLGRKEHNCPQPILFFTGSIPDAATVDGLRPQSLERDIPWLLQRRRPLSSRWFHRVLTIHRLRHIRVHSGFNASFLIPFHRICRHGDDGGERRTSFPIVEPFVLERMRDQTRPGARGQDVAHSGVKTRDAARNKIRHYFPCKIRTVQPMIRNQRGHRHKQAIPRWGGCITPFLKFPRKMDSMFNLLCLRYGSFCVHRMVRAGAGISQMDPGAIS